MLATRIRSAGRWHWLAFFAGVLGCWLLLYLMAIPAELRALETDFGAALIEFLCGGTLGGLGFPGAFAMWGLMSAAMMAPTALPAIATYEDLGHATSIRFGRLVAGYLSAWLGFSLLAAVLQMVLFRSGLVGSLGQSLSVPLSAGLLLGAGLYQFSTLKHACLSRCRAPLMVFLQHWDEGPFRNGLRMGIDCVGCCWALMLLAFVGGTMNLGFMALAMALMASEKLPDIGRHLTRPLGVALCAAGLAWPFI